jgi:putative ABC transport system permease protein
MRRRQQHASGARSRLLSADLWPLAALGLRSRPARALLSATGIAVGIATMIAVLGISTSSRAQLIARIDALGTNLLTVTPNQTLDGGTASLPASALAMVSRIGPVQSTSPIGAINASVYRNQRIPLANTNAITVYAAQTNLLTTLQGRLYRGRFLNPATEHLPAIVLGADAANALGIDRADGTTQLWLANHWYAVTGILDPLALAPELDRAALIGIPIAEHLLHYDGRPAQLYVRTDPSSIAAVQAVLAATANPVAPQDIAIADPTDALTARADATAAFQSLYLALGAIALLVGGIGIANVMIIAVLERRGEIGLRRALGAAPAHVAAQFVAEATLLALAGGAAGAVLGAFATTLYATARNWPTAVPIPDLLAAIAVAITVGATAGLYPAIKAARLSPSEALRTA